MIERIINDIKLIMTTIYVVCDIEADGPIPGPNSMISLGAVAVDKFGTNYGEFEINLLPLDNARPHPITIKWFKENAPEAYEYTQQNSVSPKKAMNLFGDWLLTLPYPRLMAAHPAPFDFMWVNWYIHTFLDDKLKNPPFTYPFFSKGAFDIQTYAVAVLKKSYTEIKRENYPKELHDNSKHSHRAIDDAREYAHFLIKLLNKG